MKPLFSSQLVQRLFMLQIAEATSRLCHSQNVHDESDQEEHHVNSDKNSHCREK
jgi:hypothetical protein